MSEVVRERKPLFSNEGYIKVGIYLAGLIFAWATMSSDIKSLTASTKRIEEAQLEQKKDNDLQRDVMKAQISLMQVDIAVLKTKLDIKGENESK